MKKLISLILVLCLSIIIIPVSVFAEGNVAPNPASYPEFADKSYGALYAHATLGGDSKETWQRWHKDEQGVNFERGLRYFFLPASADDNQVEIYNNYNVSVTIDGVKIEPYTSAFINCAEGKTITAVREDSKEYSFVVLKSDAEASVYVNDTTNSYEDYNGKIQNTDLWSFLVQNKENSVKDSACSIVDKNGTLDTILKKLKGRGNTNWKETDKKPFNLTFYDKTDIGGVVDKKFSFVSNAKDSTLLRNSIMYDLAYNVGSPYASDQSFVDFYVNGVYRGSYIACQKIDMGKNSVVSLKDTSEDVDANFNFLVEVDVWNYKADTYFVSDKGYHVVLKTPDLEDYDESDPSRNAKFNFIKNTYQRLEDALYKGTLSDIEKVCDLESLASQYLLQEFGKNCDGGYTSTFFTYNAEEDKFYAAPLWDCDSDLGAVDCVRDGCTTSTIDHTGWITRLAKYERTINPLGQAFYVKGTTSDGKTFEDICKKMWEDKFLPEINILLGKADSRGRLKSIDEYAASIEKCAYNNYVMWDFMWLCAQKNSSISKEYSEDYAGELKYLKDWTKERAIWISKTYDISSGDIEIPTISEVTDATETTVVPEEKNVYFTTDLNWDNVHYYIWSTGYVPTDWPGVKAELYETTESGDKIYKAVVPADISYIIFNDGYDGEQTVDIKLNNYDNFYNSSQNTGQINEAGKYIYNVNAGYYEDATPVESTATDPNESMSTDPSENTGSSSVTNESTPAENTGASESMTEPSDERVFGDVNLDGKVNIKDATALQKHMAKIKILSEKNLSVSDTNKDGKISISDVTSIQKKIAGLINWD